MIGRSILIGERATGSQSLQKASEEREKRKKIKQKTRKNNGNEERQGAPRLLRQLIAL